MLCVHLLFQASLGCNECRHVNGQILVSVGLRSRSAPATAPPPGAVPAGARPRSQTPAALLSVSRPCISVSPETCVFWIFPTLAVQHCVVSAFGFFHTASRSRGSSVLRPASRPFVMLSSTPLCGSATFRVPVCQLMDIWMASNWGLLWALRLRTFVGERLHGHTFSPHLGAPHGHGGSSAELLPNWLMTPELFSAGLTHLRVPAVTHEGPMFSSPRT